MVSPRVTSVAGTINPTKSLTRLGVGATPGHFWIVLKASSIALSKHTEGFLFPIGLRSRSRGRAEL